MTTHFGKRILAGFLAAVLILGVWQVPAFAEDTDGLCPHHTEHTEDCGYTQDVPCSFQCEDCAREAEDNKDTAPGDPSEPEESEGIQYPWDEMTDEEFAEWVFAEENREYLCTLLNGDVEDTYNSLLDRLDQVENDELYIELSEYLASIVRAIPPFETYENKYPHETQYAIINTNGVSGQDIVNEARKWAGSNTAYWSNSTPWEESLAWRTGYTYNGQTAPEAGGRLSFDCSGFVGRVLNDVGFRSPDYTPYSLSSILGSKYGSGFIAISIEDLISYGTNIDSSVAKARNGDYSELKPGDLIGWTSGSLGRHIIIYAGLNENGQPTMVEFTGNGYYDRVITSSYQSSFQYGARLTVLEPGYLSKCKYSPTYCQVETNATTVLKTLPCSKGTDPSSADGPKLGSGVKLTVCGVYKNTAGNYWYKVLQNDTAGICYPQDYYIYAGNTSFVKAVADNSYGVSVSGTTKPSTITAGIGFPVTGAISSQYNGITSGGVQIYAGHNITSGNAVTGQLLNVNGEKTITLSGTIDSNTRYDTLSAGGSYTYVVVANVTGYYFNGGENLQSYSKRVILEQANFSVVKNQAEPTYHLDLNGFLDGQSVDNIFGSGTADVYINGVLDASGVYDYYKAWPAGTTYEIKNITATAGHRYNGVYSGSLSGTIGGSSAAVVLSFSVDYTSITPGVYYLLNTETGKYLSVDGCGDGNGVNVSVSTRENSDGMRFEVTAASDGYILRPLCSSRILNANGTAPGSGANIDLWDNLNESSEWWKFETVDGGYIIHSAFNSSCVLDTNGSNVYLATIDRSASQVWSLKTRDEVENQTESTVNITYKNRSGDVVKTVPMGEYTIEGTYDKQSGSYFMGWSFEENASMFDIRPGDKIDVTTSVTLYPVYLSHAKAVSGEPALIYNISDFPASGYTIQKTTKDVSASTTESYWGAWSGWSTTAVSSSSTVQVESRTAYGWYYFECPNCHAHMHGYGTCWTWCGGCGATTTADGAHTMYDPTNWSEAQDWYGTTKYYAVINGERWFKWDDGGTQTQYRSRELVTDTTTTSKTYPAYVIQPVSTYTVSYNANGGTGEPASQTKTYGTALTLSSTKPTRANSSAGSYTVTLDVGGGSVNSNKLSAARTTSYTFKNWNTAANGSGTSYASGASYTDEASVTLYAQWNSSTATASVTLPTPTKTGATFQNWNTKADGSGTAYNAGTSFTPSGNVTLYAIWNLDQTKTGLVKDSDGIYRYYYNGAVDTTKTGLYDGIYLNKGVEDTGFTGLYNNLYVYQGRYVGENYTGFCLMDGKYYLIYNGSWVGEDFSDFYLDKATNTYYYIESGIYYADFTGLNGNYYVYKGMWVGPECTGLYELDGQWYYIYNGSWVGPDYNAFYYNAATNTYYSIQNGLCDLTFTGLNGMNYIYKGMWVGPEFTGLYQLNGQWIYVFQGYWVGPDYTGYYNDGTTCYYIENGVMVNDVMV